MHVFKLAIIYEAPTPQSRRRWIELPLAARDSYQLYILIQKIIVTIKIAA